MLLMRKMRHFSTMKAITISRPGPESKLVLQHREVPKCGPSQVKVKVLACGVCHRDLLDRSGAFPFVKDGVISGHEIAGIVDEAGEQVASHYPKGTRVVSLHWESCGQCRGCERGEQCVQGFHSAFGLTRDGGYAEYVQANSSAFVKVGTECSLTATEAASVCCTYGTAYQAFSQGRLRAAERVLVTGASGGVGAAAVQLARSLGCHVVALTTSAHKADRLRLLGAHDVLVGTDPQHWPTNLHNSVDVVLETVGRPTFSLSLRSLRRGGRLLLIGNVTGDAPSLPLGLLITKGLSVIGSDSCTRDNLQQTFELLQRHNLRPTVHDVIKLEAEALDAAHHTLRSRSVFGRIVVQLSGEPW